MYDQSFKFSNSNLFAFLLAVTLPYGNVTKLVGIEDGFSRLIIPLLILIFLVGELYRNQINVKLCSELFILLIALFVGVLGFFQNQIGGIELTGYFVKVLALLVVHTYIKRYDKISATILHKYYSFFLWSLVISIPIWVFYPVPEFVLYDGSENRFAGLHFELFNFCFSLCIFLVSWTMSGKHFALGFIIFLILGYNSGSNMFPILAFVFLIPRQILKVFQFRFFSCLGVLLILFTPVGIGLFLNSLDFLIGLGLREQGQFDAQGSSIFVRLFPFSLAVEYIHSLGYLGLFPSGLGHFESTELVKFTENSFGGTGSPKAMVDLGIFLFGLLGIVVGLKMARAYSVWGEQRFMIVRLNICCLLFISFGAGFFNLVAWTILLMTSTWKEKANY